MLSLVVAVAGRPDLGPSSTLTLPRLNSLIQRVIVAYEGTLSANVPNTSSRIFEAVRSYKCRYLMVARIAVFSIFHLILNSSLFKNLQKIQ